MKVLGVCVVLFRSQAWRVALCITQLASALVCAPYDVAVSEQTPASTNRCAVLWLRMTTEQVPRLPDPCA